MADLVRLTHPLLPDQPIEVLPDAVEGHRRSGWQTAADLAVADKVVARAEQDTSAAPDTTAQRRRPEATTSTSGTGKE